MPSCLGHSVTLAQLLLPLRKDTVLTAWSNPGHLPTMMVVTALVLCTAVTLCASTVLLSEEQLAAPVNNASLIAQINADPRSTWVASASQRFAQSKLADAVALCGAWTHTSHPDGRTPPNLPVKQPSFETAVLPKDFDPREAWPWCPSISHVRDQTDCGACWAFGSTQAFNDRHCIKTNDTALLSPQDTASCCSGSSCLYSNGCVGGWCVLSMQRRSPWLAGLSSARAGLAPHGYGS
jgi:hypothetical protein